MESMQRAEGPVVHLPVLRAVRCKVGTELELFDREGKRRAAIGGDRWFVLHTRESRICAGPKDFALTDTAWRAFQAVVRERYGVKVPDDMRPTRPKGL